MSLALDHLNCLACTVEPTPTIARVMAVQTAINLGFIQLLVNE
jgi:hypothetical protein